MALLISVAYMKKARNQILTTQIKTFKPKILYKNKLIKHTREFRRSYKKKRVIAVHLQLS